MINLNEVEEEIKKLEDGKTCYQVCERLSALYIVRDHLKGKCSAPVEVADRTSSQSQRDDMWLSRILGDYKHAVFGLLLRR